MIKIPTSKYIGLAEKHYNNIESYLLNSVKFYLKCCYKIKPSLNKNNIDLRSVNNINYNIKRSLFSAISSIEYKCINEKQIFDIKYIDLQFIKNVKVLSELLGEMLNVKSEIYIKKIVVASPSSLEGIFNKVQAKVKNILIANRIFKSIFNYNKFIKNGINNWNAYDFCQQLNVNVCPYCNRIYTNTIRTSKKNIIRPALDHYIPQTKYPIFALSFYNLIPSCTNCNSYIKGDSEKFTFEKDVFSNYVHPYIDYEDFEFQFKPLDISIYDGDKEKIVIKAEKPGTTKIEKSLQFFEIDNIYQAHKNVVSTLILKRREYNDTNLEMISKLIGKRKEELFNIVFGFMDDEETVDQSLGKLRKDIVEQLKKITT